MIRIGDIIPAQRLQAYHAGALTEVNLGELRGAWEVLLFYPGDFTFVCPTELREATRLYPAFQAAGAEVLSVSTDSVWVHKAWADASPSIAAIPFPMLADPTGELARAFGIYVEDQGVALRGGFVIDPDGRVAAIEIHGDPIGRNIEELLRRVQAARHVRENPGVVCPVGWRPGEEILRPGLELVGAI